MSPNSATATAAAPASGSLAPDPHLLRIRDLVYQVAGIFHPDHKLRFLEDRCGRRMKALSITNLRDYQDCLTSRPNHQAEMVALLNETTVGETYFFRNEPQLDALRRVILPRIIEAKAKLPVKRMRIWSAGCSTGEEPYTLALLLFEEAKGLLEGWSFDIQATDLNERSVAHAKRGVYGDYSIRNITPQIREKYFVEESGELSVGALARSRVTIQRLNLLDDSRMTFMKGIDIIFCCNVLIYFDGTSKSRVIQHFYNSLLPHGYLFLGHAESLFGINDDFHLIHLPSTTAYGKGEQNHGKRRLP
jgi:chemotaxis protein methyltransferase CheR